MTKRDGDLFALLGKSQDLASEIVDFVQDRVSGGNPGATAQQSAVIKAALAIAYTTLSKATGTNIHDTIEMVMTIYKNTQVVEDDHE
jgi:hypothetical protein